MNLLDESTMVLAGGMARALENYEATADQLRGSVKRLVSEVEDRNATIRKLMADIASLKTEVQNVHEALNTEQMHTAGLEAQRNALVNQHQDSPLLGSSGEAYSDPEMQGKVKSKARKIYEAAFDAKARELGISNPAARRTN